MFSLKPPDANDPQGLMRRKEPNKQTISLSRVTDTAVACSSVCKSIFLCGKDDFTNTEAPPEGPQTISMNIVIYIKIF